jgi:hypothetical protein
MHKRIKWRTRIRRNIIFVKVRIKIWPNKLGLHLGGDNTWNWETFSITK